jgi:hypothetical protein
MALDINALRAAFAKKSESSGEGNNGFWDKFYPFYKMDFEQTVRFRFLPDRDEENPLGFIVVNQYHELLVNGQKKKIACLKMYGESCPCCEMSSKYYNEGDEKMGKAFWKKTDYIAQGLVINSPFDYPIKPDENPVRMISIGPKLYKVIEAKIVKGDMDEMPTDPVNGYDFLINKTKQGEYADYTTSDFARRSTPVPEELLARADLYDLKNYRFGKIERAQMETMIEAFLTGKTYDNKDSGGYTPHSTGHSGLDAKLNEQKSTPTVSAAPAPASTAADPAAPAPAATAKLSPQEILRKLKERQQNGA